MPNVQLAKGTPIRVRGMGKRATGRISRDVEPGAKFITYRSDYNAGEYVALVEKVRVEKRARR